MRWLLTTLGLWIGTSACGGIAIVDDAGIGGEANDGDGTSGIGGAGELDCTHVSFDMSFPARECTTVDTCDITGRAPSGQELRETCYGERDCRLYLDDVQICACRGDAIDWAATCSNGLPTCSDWKLNYTTITYCPKAP